MNALTTYWLRWILNIPRMVVLGAIRLYQRTLSPDHGPLFKGMYPHGYCRFHPTCSEYTYQAVEKLGLISGLIHGTGRIFRCNPWNPGGYDPVPQKKGDTLI